MAGAVADELPARSVFGTAAAASAFFERGSVGYSATGSVVRHDGLELRCQRWGVRPLTVTLATSTYLADPTRFPHGSVEFDSALLMRDVEHTWHAQPDLYGDVVEAA